MLARFCRFYPAYTVAQALDMMASHFFALYDAMARIEDEEEARALTVHHAGDPQKRVNELVARMKGVKSGTSAAKLVHEGHGVAAFEDTAGEIEALRERQRQSAERLKKERQEWLNAQKKPA